MRSTRSTTFFGLFARNEQAVFVRDRFAYRGQSREDWTLKPSILRIFSPLERESSVRAEEALLNTFISQAHVYVATFSAALEQGSAVDWWPLMQQHGAPTRLLDWTTSPFVATYFAVTGDFESDAAIWCHNRVALDTVMTNSDAPKYERFVQIDGNFAKDSLWCYSIHLKRPTARMIAQRSVFTLCSDICADHVSALRVINATDSPDPLGFNKVMVPARLKGPLLRRLIEMNITAATLFPGIDGIGRSIREQATLHRLMIDYGGPVAGSADVVPSGVAS